MTLPRAVPPPELSDQPRPHSALDPNFTAALPGKRTLRDIHSPKATGRPPSRAPRSRRRAYLPHHGRVTAASKLGRIPCSPPPPPNQPTHHDYTRQKTRVLHARRPRNPTGDPARH